MLVELPFRLDVQWQPYVARPPRRWARRHRGKHIEHVEHVQRRQQTDLMHDLMHERERGGCQLKWATCR